MIKELLIMAVDKFNPDSVINQSGCYKKGDIVCIRPEGSEWGAKESLPMFLVVKADLTEQEIEEFVKLEKETILNTDGETEIKTRRKYKFDFEKNMGVDKLKIVKESGWRVEGIEKSLIRNKNDVL